MSPSSQAERLQACLEAIEAGSSVEEAVGRFPQARDELLPLVATARLVRVGRPRPAAAWRRDTARDWGVGSVESWDGRGVGSEVPLVVRRPRRWVVRVAAMAAAVVLALGGLVVASADSAPGDRLYPIRRGVERVAEVVAGRPAPEPLATVDAMPGGSSNTLPGAEPESRQPRTGAAATTRNRSRGSSPSTSPRPSPGDATGTVAEDRDDRVALAPAPAAPSTTETKDQDAGGLSSPEAGLADGATEQDAPNQESLPAQAPEAPGGAGPAPAAPERGIDPERPPPPAPPAGLEPPAGSTQPEPGAAPLMPPPVLPIASPTPRSVGLAPVGPGPGVLPATGSLSGKVLDKHGKAMPRATVSVYRAAQRFSFSRRGPRPIAVVRTETDGSYRVEGLLPEAYVVAVRNPGFFAGETYHPDAPDRWRAESVDVLSGRTTEGVDIRQPERRWDHPFVEGPGTCRIVATDC
jgi:hypothetical protein